MPLKLSQNQKAGQGGRALRKGSQICGGKAAYELAITYYCNALGLIEQICRSGSTVIYDKRKIELALAEALMLNGKYEQALLLYNNHCINKEEKSIEDCEIIFRVGCIHLNIGEYLQAQDCFHNALTILKIPFCNRKSGFLLTFLFR